MTQSPASTSGASAAGGATPATLSAALNLIGKRRLAFAFGAIVAVFVFANAVAIYQRASVEARNRKRVDESLTSVGMVSRLTHDVDLKRLLVDTHIFQSAQPDMAVIEARIRQVDASFAETARAFDPLTIRDGEGAVWTDLRQQVAMIEAPIEQALILSRENRDRDARNLLTALDRQFDAIEPPAGGRSHGGAHR